jgi:ATP-binding protein involved in chromosome partitioning
VSLQLALALSRRGLAVGLLDADLYGPDIPLMLNLTRQERAQQWDLWRRSGISREPLERHGMKVMSVGFLLGEREALTMPGMLLSAALKQLVEQVEWGALESSPGRSAARDGRSATAPARRGLARRSGRRGRAA